MRVQIIMCTNAFGRSLLLIKLNALVGWSWGVFAQVGHYSICGCAPCKFCNEHIESIDHFLLLCYPVWSLRTRILAWIGVQWVVPPSLVALLTWWFDRKMKPKLKMIWDCIPFAIFWTLQIKRNGFISKNEALDWEELLELIKLKIIFWARTKWGPNSFTSEDFLIRLDSIISSL